MRRLAIAGVSGYIGTRLLARLDGEERLERIIGVDRRPPRLDVAKLSFYTHDITQPFEDILITHEIDSAVNLAFVLRPTRDTARARQIAIDGNRNFLQACHRAGVKQILYLSSYAVYGAHPDNPLPLTEDAPSRPRPDFQYGWDKAQAENMIREFAAAHPDVDVTILRPCPVIGPRAADAVIALMFKPPVMIGVARHDPLLQLVHEEDLVELIVTLLRLREPGVFNVAGDGAIRYSQVARIVGKRMLKLPERLLHFLMGVSWALRLQHGSPSSGLAFIKYPVILSTEKLKREIGFKLGHSTQEALLSFLHAGQRG